MLRKFLNGIVFGAGLALAFIAVLVVYFQFFFKASFEHRIESSPAVVDTPPKLEAQKTYLGSLGIYNGNFNHGGSVLAAGPGEIVGKVLANEQAVAGVKLRLALNGSVKSQWAISGADGVYRIGVPVGEYRIDGFELDRSVADSVLAGKIDAPHMAFSSNTFKVTGDDKGRGLTLRYVDPVRKKIAKNVFSVSEDIVIGWEPYPGASEYSIQIYEKSEPNGFRGNNTLFDWSSQPRVSGNTLNLKTQGIQLKAGKFYLVEIFALDKTGGSISETASNHPDFDFEIIE